MSKRDVSPLLQLIRKFLAGREIVTSLRYQMDISTRSPGPPNLPEGPHARLSANYYLGRDGRREAAPPVVVVDEGVVPKLAAPEDKPAPKLIAERTPGKVYNWD